MIDFLYDKSTVDLPPKGLFSILDINGTAQMTGFMLPVGQSSGYVLTSNHAGWGTWQPAPTGGGSDNDWTISGSDIYSTLNGNVGIGTNNPLSKLSVGADGLDHAAIYAETAEVVGHGVYGRATNTESVTNYGGRFAAAGTSGRGVEGMATGLNGIGVYGLATDIYGQGVYGSGADVGVFANGGRADFWANNGTYGNSSSVRWKDSIVKIDNPLEKLAKIRGVYFDWDEEHGGAHTVGMIAEEVGKVLPEIVFYEENGIDAKGMDYSKLTPLLVEAINAQQELIDELTRRIVELED